MNIVNTYFKLVDPSCSATPANVHYLKNEQAKAKTEQGGDRGTGHLLLTKKKKRQSFGWGQTLDPHSCDGGGTGKPKAKQNLKIKQKATENVQTLLC